MNTSSSISSTSNDTTILNQIPPLFKNWIKKTARCTLRGFYLNSLKHIIGVEWQNRYFVLEEGILRYYKGEKDSYPFGIELKGTIELKDIFLADINHPDTNSTRLLLLSKQTYEKELSLLFDSVSKAEFWRNAIESHIKYSNSDHSVITDNEDKYTNTLSIVIQEVNAVINAIDNTNEIEFNSKTDIKTLPAVSKCFYLINNILILLDSFNNIISEASVCKVIMKKLQDRLIYILKELEPVLNKEIYFLENFEMKFNQLNKCLMEAKQVIEDCYNYIASHDNGDCDPSKAINEIDIDITNYINFIFQLSDLDKLLEHNDIYCDEIYDMDDNSNNNNSDNNNGNALTCGMNEINHITKNKQNALELYKQTLDIEIKLYGYEHLEIVSTLKKIANILKELNRSNEALETYKELLDIQKKIYGSNHIVIIETLSRIGIVFKDLGMNEEFHKINFEINETKSKIRN